MAGRNTVEITLAARDRASRQVKSAFASIKSSASSALGMLGNAAALAGVSLGALPALVAKTGISYNAMQEQSAVAWKTLLGSATEAQDMLQRISDFAKATPFETADVDMMAKYMHNAGLEGKGLFKELMKASDVASAFAIPADQAKEMVRQMSQVRQAGVAYTEDLNILQDRGVPIYKAIAKEIGGTAADVKMLASKGKLSSEVYIKAFDNISKGVKGASKAQSETFNGMISTMQDNLKIISGEIMKGAFEKLKGTLDSLMPYLDQFSATLKDEGLHAALAEVFGEDKVTSAEKLFTTIKDVGVTAFNLLKGTVKFVYDNFEILLPVLVGAYTAIKAFQIIKTVQGLMVLWKASTIAQTIAQGGLNTVLIANPIGIVVTAIGLLVAAGIYLYRNWDTVRSKTTQLWNKLGAFRPVADAILGPIDDLIRGAVHLADNWDSTKSVWGNVWDFMKRSAASAVNDVIEKINSLIKKINTIPGVKVPIIPKVHWGDTKPGKSSSGSSNNSKHSQVAQYAKGTDFHPGGLAIVGEEGPELLSLPRGSSVKTASETKGLLGGKTVNNTYNITVTGNNVDITEQRLIRTLQREALLYG